MTQDEKIDSMYKPTATQTLDPLNEDGTPKVEEVPVTVPEVKDEEGEDLDEGHVDDEKEEDEKGDEDEEEIPVVVTPEVTPKPEAPPVDFKDKFKNSTRRNQIVEAQLKELTKVLGDITKQEVPSDEEMTATDPDWEYRSDFEKNQAIKLVVLERRQNNILNTFSNITRESESTEKIFEFIESTEQLKGKEEKFYTFATDPKNAGAPAEVLLKAFLFEVDGSLPAPVAPVVPEKKEKAPQLSRATPTNGQSGKPKQAGTYSDEELTQLRTKNPKKYFQLIRQGKI